MLITAKRHVSLSIYTRISGWQCKYFIYLYIYLLNPLYYWCSTSIKWLESIWVQNNRIRCVYYRIMYTIYLVYALIIINTVQVGQRINKTCVIQLVSIYYILYQRWFTRNNSTKVQQLYTGVPFVRATYASLVQNHFTQKLQYFTEKITFKLSL